MDNGTADRRVDALEHSDVVAQARSAGMFPLHVRVGISCSRGGWKSVRFTHLLRSLPDEVDAAGHERRPSAKGCDDVDSSVAQELSRSQSAW